jgi:hypothetical protein
VVRLLPSRSAGIRVRPHQPIDPAVRIGPIDRSRRDVDRPRHPAGGASRPRGVRIGESLRRRRRRRRRGGAHPRCHGPVPLLQLVLTGAGGTRRHGGAAGMGGSRRAGRAR